MHFTGESSVSMDVPTPNAVFCPKCGVVMELERIVDPKTLVKLQDSGYVAGARGNCECGISAILAMKEMPANPTFTLMFNVFKLK